MSLALTLLLAPALWPVAHASNPLFAAGGATTLPDLVEKVLPGVVNVATLAKIRTRGFGMEEFLQGWGLPRERTHTSLGSGFILDGEGRVLTNNHVVADATEVMLTLWDKRQFKARIVGKDEKMDLAVLQIRDAGKTLGDLKPMALGDSNATRIGESVFAVGNPFGLQHTVTVGIISAKNRTIGLGPFDNFIQTDAAVNPGNSGGPLFNLKGEVIGINTAIRSETGQSGGLSFAIPAQEAKTLIPDLIRYGRVPRPWMGVMAERMSLQLQLYYDLPVAKGVLIYNLVQDAPAVRGGLKQGDIVEAVDGTVVEDPYDVERLLAKHRPNEKAVLKVRRGRKQLELSLKLEELPRLDRIPRGII